jgi:hypothetical protein
MHEKHGASHALSQQTPSTQNELSHSPGSEQGSPIPSRSHAGSSVLIRVVQAPLFGLQ